MERKMSGVLESDSVRERLDQIPILHVRGTHFLVGFTIGRQFKGMIDDLLSNWIFLSKILLPAYNSEDGRNIYEKSLKLCTQKFPQYVEELQGMAQGSGAPFYKLFLLHIESLIVPADSEDEIWNTKLHPSSGCTSILCNSDSVLLGHNEDTCPEFLNNVYIVSAEILGENGERVEKFSTLTYAGHLPGYTMGYNSSGLVYSINTIYPKVTYADRTPRTFLTRALLGAPNLKTALSILRDEGTGTSDGFSLNISFAQQEGAPVMHNVEVGPSSDGAKESELSVLTLTHGDTHSHCNKYLRLQIPELPGIAMNSSTHRHKAIGKHLKPTTFTKIKELLSESSDEEYPVFRIGGKVDYIKTVVSGIFDIKGKKWFIYLNPPISSQPLVVLPMEFD